MDGEDHPNSAHGYKNGHSISVKVDIWLVGSQLTSDLLARRCRVLIASLLRSSASRWWRDLNLETKKTLKIDSSSYLHRWNCRQTATHFVHTLRLFYEDGALFLLDVSSQLLISRSLSIHGIRSIFIDVFLSFLLLLLSTWDLQCLSLVFFFFFYENTCNWMKERHCLLNDRGHWLSPMINCIFSRRIGSRQKSLTMKGDAERVVISWLFLSIDLISIHG